MSRMIQIRNVPDALHQELKVRAARAGMTLSDYLLREIEELAAKPPLEELLAELAARPQRTFEVDSVELIRQQRGPI